MVRSSAKHLSSDPVCDSVHIRFIVFRVRRTITGIIRFGRTTWNAICTSKNKPDENWTFPGTVNKLILKNHAIPIKPPNRAVTYVKRKRNINSGTDYEFAAIVSTLFGITLIIYTIVVSRPRYGLAARRYIFHDRFLEKVKKRKNITKYRPFRARYTTGRMYRRIRGRKYRTPEF